MKKSKYQDIEEVKELDVDELLDKIDVTKNVIKEIKKERRPSMQKYRITNKALHVINLIIENSTVQLAAKQSTTAEFKRVVPTQISNLAAKGILLLEKLKVE